MTAGVTHRATLGTTLVGASLIAIHALRRVGDFLLVDDCASGRVSKLDGGKGNVANVEIGGQRIDHPVIVLEVVRAQGFAQCLERELDLAGAKVGDRRNLFDRDLLLGEALDVAEQTLLTRFGQGDGRAFATGSTHATDAVHI